MSKEVFSMSTNELDRLKIIEKIINKQLTQRLGAHRLGMSTRHIRRLTRNYERYGPQGIISQKRGKPSNRSYSQALKEQVKSLITLNYHDYGPTLISERLAQRHGLEISAHTLRRWMIEWSLWKSRHQKVPKVYQPRYRKPREGELVQIDGSPHDWFEGRAPGCTLLVIVDDATSKILKMRLAPWETTLDYFDLLEEYFLEHGKPMAMYMDKHAVFKVNIKEAKSGDGLTQFGRVLKTLGIQMHYANSPQAKGRVERANRVLQDRLTKALREENISDIKSANQFLDEFTKEYNERFAKPPQLNENAHLALNENEKNKLSHILSIQTLRKVDKNLLVRYENTLYLLKEKSRALSLRHSGVMVCENRNGEVTITSRNTPLRYEVYRKDFQEANVVPLKELHAKMARRAREFRPKEKLEKVNIFIDP